MLTKTVRAETMMEALSQVKVELGPDALVVSARQIPGGLPWQVWRKPLVEVIAIRLEKGESVSTINEKEEHVEKSGNAHSIVKDVSRKDAFMPKPGKTAETLQKSRLPFEPEKPSMAHEIEMTTAVPEESTSKVKSLEFPKVSENPHSENASRIDLLQQLGKDEIIEDLDIVQISESGKSQLPPLQLPQIPWNPPKEIIEHPDGAWPLLEKLYQHLLNQGVDTGLVKRVCQVSADTLGYQAALDDKKIIEHLRRQMEAYIKVQFESNPKEKQIICLVGPSGAGKTSVAAKLAARNIKLMKQNVVWICADTTRTGSIAEAKSYTEAINVPLRVAYTPQELYDAVESADATDTVIIDTPAFNPRNEESIKEIGELLTTIPNRETWIVIPATAKENDLINAVSTLGVFNPRALVITKLDETSSFGAIYNIAFRTQLPLAYYTRGSRIMDDLLPSSASRLVQAIFSERFDKG